jgi:hypothetical protein
MTAKQARTFLLKPESYCSLDLPPYFVFSKILSAVVQEPARKDPHEHVF